MEKMRWWTVTLFAALAGPASAWAGVGERGDWHGHMWGGWGWGGMIFGPIMMIVFLAVIVAVVVLAIRWLGGAGPMPSARGGKTALEILDERFALGEIDKAEYEERKKVLSA